MAVLTLLIDRLGLPHSKHKCVEPTIYLEYLGIILDDRMEARLPLDNVRGILQLIKRLMTKSTCTKLELFQLLGHFNFASCVILPGRTLIHLSTVKELLQWIRLDDLLYVFPCVILFVCFSVLLVLRLPCLGKRELILVLFIRLFGLCLFGFVGFLFLLGSEKGCGL